MSPDSWRELARQVSTAPAEELDILRERGTDVRIARVQNAEGTSVVVKCWNRRGVRGAVRRWSRTNIGRREYEALRRLREAGASCPFPHAYLHLPPATARHTEALISSDLGVCADSTEVYKDLLRNPPEQLEAFESELIRTTVAMVERGLLDTDHRLPNYVVPDSGTPMRIDFELCVPVRFSGLHPQRLGIMLGTFLGSMVFAVQPDVQRAEAFSRKLFQELRPSSRVIAVAQRTLDRMMERQANENGIRSELDLERCI